jgi:hypothetical protein
MLEIWSFQYDAPSGLKKGSGDVVTIMTSLRD